MLDYILLAVISFSFGVYARGVFDMNRESAASQVKEYKNLAKPFIRAAEFKPVMASGLWTTKKTWDQSLDIPDTC